MADIYNNEINKLKQAGNVAEIGELMSHKNHGTFLIIEWRITTNIVLYSSAPLHIKVKYEMTSSLPCPNETKELLLKIRAVLFSGGFEIRQWARNFPSVVEHLPSAARSDIAELWLNRNRTDPVEGALGLSWHCVSDTLGYRHRPVSYQTLTMRNVYKVLASQ